MNCEVRWLSRGNAVVFSTFEMKMFLFFLRHMLLIPIFLQTTSIKFQILNYKRTRSIYCWECLKQSWLKKMFSILSPVLYFCFCSIKLKLQKLDKSATFKIFSAYLKGSKRNFYHAFTITIRLKLMPMTLRYTIDYRT